MSQTNLTAYLVDYTRAKVIAYQHHFANHGFRFVAYNAFWDESSFCYFEPTELNVRYVKLSSPALPNIVMYANCVR